jgi:exopolysaccharide biosynthesis polyprenyl glycosylphosphotransferase
MNSRVAPGTREKVNLCLDLAFLLLGILFASTLSQTPGTGEPPEMVWFLTLAVAVWIITSTALRYYDPWVNRMIVDDAAMVTVLVLAVATVVGIANFLAPEESTVPKVSYFLLITWPVLVLNRLFLNRLFASTQEEPLAEVLVVGTEALGRVTAEDLERSKTRRQQVVGFLNLPGDKKPERLGRQVLGTSDQIESVLSRIPVTEVFIAGNIIRDCDAIQKVIKVCETLGVPFALPLTSGFRLDRARLLDPKAAVDGYLHFTNVTPKPSQMALKRLFDIVVSAAALWLLLPLLSVVALLVKLSSKGPIFFKQVRVGLNGRHFHMLKFRSMVTDAEQLKAQLESKNEQAGPVFKMKKDPRVTSIGRYLRRYSIDELPQLINVLRGDMSLVGPRPPVPKEVLQYKPWQRRRLSVRPGLTCIWQVSGRNQISFEEWMYMDMQYIDHWSLSEDFNLILKTVPAVLTGRGAS